MHFIAVNQTEVNHFIDLNIKNVPEMNLSSMITYQCTQWKSILMSLTTNSRLEALDEYILFYIKLLFVH